jgi:hypothetical protein
MARRNSGRLSAPEVERDEAPPAPLIDNQSEDSMFSFVAPTEFVDVPSKGLLYSPDHPLYGVDTIEIKHMTAKEEDLLTSEALIRKGLALDRLLQSVIVDSSIKVNDLLVGDKNALLIATRITGYGPHYNTTITCPSCAEKKEDNIDLATLSLKEANLPENASLTDEGTYIVSFEDFKLDVEIRLLKGSDEQEVGQRRQKRRKLKLPETNITDQLEAMIVSVNGFTERTAIKQFCEACPASISRQIRTAYEEAMPDLDLTHEFECDNCGYMGKVGMPLTAAFFWPDA